MKIGDVEREVQDRLSQMIDDGQVVRKEYLINAIVGGHPLPEFEDADWYRVCSRETVSDLVRRAARNLENPENYASEQLAFPGFPLVQRSYCIERNGEQVVVPTRELTGREIEVKAKELRRMGFGCLEHAEQLERFGKELVSSSPVLEA